MGNIGDIEEMDDIVYLINMRDLGDMVDIGDMANTNKTGVIVDI